MITAPQIRAARAFLNWSQDELAKQAGVSAPTIKRVELKGPDSSSLGTIKAIKAALEAGGVSFSDEGCVCPSATPCKKTA
ncbi:helix-turn-helix domain-containing protein [Micavibrio aeruginosavorus]|uniref:Transcriptional regulator, XRE family n=1 Tax=Micavibrio aeruginosavorus (strain ARL-13) TaxID=856793 RepID=G2KNW1_MICAA|nr:helix-turn-helix transcriptional regulator [Micavibrio aeruginosavorus]AEP10756.1 transcriptional regulator, XRE family [Micavibrio aeruginosavorus ARL-13]